MSFWNRSESPHPLVAYLWRRVFLLGALFLYLGVFYDLPAEAYLFAGLVFLICTTTGVPWSVQAREQLIEVKGGLSDSGEAAKFTLPIHLPVLSGLFCVVAAAVLTYVESMQIVSDPWLRQLHGASLAIVGVLLMAFRQGGYVDVEGRRALIRWYSLFGIRFPIRRALKSGDRLVLYRLLRRHSRERGSSVSVSTRLCLVGSEGAWTFLRGATASDASAVASSLGLESFLCHTDDASRGLAKERGLLAVKVEDPSHLRVGAPAPPVNPFMAFLLVVVGLSMMGLVAWALWPPVPLLPATEASPNAPASVQPAQKSASKELVDKGVELYLEAVEKDLTPTQREKMLQDAVAAFEQAAKLGARENHFHGQALFALQRYDEGLALMAKSDHSGDAREQLASEFRADGHYELAFKFVESALTARAPCERLILRANLLLDLGRTEDGLYQVNALQSCKDSPSFDELARRAEALKV